MLSLYGPEVRFSDKVTNLVIFLHGYGADGYNLISLAEEFKDAIPNALFCSPNAPFQMDSSYPGYKWFSLSNMLLPNLLNGLDNACKYLDKYITKQTETNNIDPKNVILVGFSQGSMLSMHYNYHFNKVKMIIAYSGKFIFADKKAHSNLDTPLILIHGDEDDIITIEESINSIQNLKKIGADPLHHICKRLPHSINFEGIETAKKFIKTIL